MTAPLARANPIVKRLRALVRDPKTREAEAVMIVEGPRLARLALERASVELLAVGIESRDAHADIVDRAIDAAAPVVVLGPGVADSVADVRATQGVVAIVARPQPFDLGRLDADPLVIVVEQLSDPGNVGTLWRSAAGFGVDAIVLGPGSVDAYNPKTLRASAGAVFTVPVLEAKVSITTMLETLGDRGITRLGAAADGEPADRVDLRGATALVIGHETRGLSPGLPLDGRIAIPMSGDVESLNAGMAASVLAYEAARQRAGR